jgi:hypothetical protein
LLNASKRQEQKIRDFITSQSLHLNLYSQHEQALITFKTNSAVKPVFLDDLLYKTLAIYSVNHKQYEVSRIRAALKQSQQGTFDTLTLLPPSKQEDESSRKSLFLRGKDYRIADLQDYLKQNGILTVLVEGRLSTTGNKVQVYFEPTTGQIRLDGVLSKEYFIVRSLIY